MIKESSTKKVTASRSNSGKKPLYTKIKFKMQNAKRYLGKCEGEITHFKIVMGTDLLHDEELFISVLIHELLHMDYFLLAREGVLTYTEAEAISQLHDSGEVVTGNYCGLMVDHLHWDEHRKKKKMMF